VAPCERDIQLIVNQARGICAYVAATFIPGAVLRNKRKEQLEAGRFSIQSSFSASAEWVLYNNELQNSIKQAVGLIIFHKIRSKCMEN